MEKNITLNATLRVEKVLRVSYVLENRLLNDKTKNNHFLYSENFTNIPIPTLLQFKSPQEYLSYLESISTIDERGILYEDKRIFAFKVVEMQTIADFRSDYGHQNIITQINKETLSPKYIVCGEVLTALEFKEKYEWCVSAVEIVLEKEDRKKFTLFFKYAAEAEKRKINHFDVAKLGLPILKEAQAKKKPIVQVGVGSFLLVDENIQVLPTKHPIL